MLGAVKNADILKLPARGSGAAGYNPSAGKFSALHFPRAYDMIISSKTADI